jgi:hypothetical protein
MIQKRGTRREFPKSDGDQMLILSQHLLPGFRGSPGDHQTSWDENCFLLLLSDHQWKQKVHVGRLR